MWFCEMTQKQFQIATLHHCYYITFDNYLIQNRDKFQQFSFTLTCGIIKLIKKLLS